MADIELVVRISEEDYKKISNSNPSYADDFSIYYAIKNGTPLPKGHGDLIDRDKVSSKFVSLIRKFYKMFPSEKLLTNIDRAKINEVQHCIRVISEEVAIIEADKEESENE